MISWVWKTQPKEVNTTYSYFHNHTHHAGRIFSSRATFKNRSTIFTLGTRDTVLTTELEDPIIVIPQAHKGEKKVNYVLHIIFDISIVHIWGSFSQSPFCSHRQHIKGVPFHQWILQFNTNVCTRIFWWNFWKGFTVYHSEGCFIINTNHNPFVETCGELCWNMLWQHRTISLYSCWLSLPGHYEATTDTLSWGVSPSENVACNMRVECLWLCVWMWWIPFQVFRRAPVYYVAKVSSRSDFKYRKCAWCWSTEAGTHWYKTSLCMLNQ